MNYVHLYENAADLVELDGGRVIATSWSLSETFAVSEGDRRDVYDIQGSTEYDPWGDAWHAHYVLRTTRSGISPPPIDHRLVQAFWCDHQVSVGERVVFSGGRSDVVESLAVTGRGVIAGVVMWVAPGRHRNGRWLVHVRR